MNADTAVFELIEPVYLRNMTRPPSHVSNHISWRVREFFPLIYLGVLQNINATVITSWFL